MKKFAVIVAGCGFEDGTEITEAVSTLIALGEFKASYQIFAPNIEATTKNHRDHTETGPRNLLTESARISRGQSLEFSELDPNKYDGVIFPGGFGAALSLSNWAMKGAQCEVHPKVQWIIEEFHAQSKPIGALCIAPTLLARTLGQKDINITIGNDKETALEIEKTGAHHVDCVVTDFITDRENKIVTTPAYMLEATPYEVFQGIRGLVKEIVEMA